MNVPRPEYPRPQFVRPDWLCLNGEWQFEMDLGDSGLERGLNRRDLKDRITVPFCPESPLSGIGHTDFMQAVWYRRTVTIPEAWKGRRVLLHFQAVDYDTTVWVNGVEVVRHRGGFTPFTCDLYGIASPGEAATIVVRARDDSRPPQPRGKQSQRYENWGCMYTRTTGIWQTVWLEPVPDVALRRPRLTPDVANGVIRLEQPITQNRPGYKVRATLRDANGVISTASCAADMDLSPRLDLPVPANRRRLWSPRDPHLYDVEIELMDANGAVVDRATSYAGLRSVTLDGQAIKINGEVIFQRLVLDQGFYPDGILTAPSDEALRRDIELSQAVGFNGARLHQKVFEERFLYHADRLGYLVWGEFADWGNRRYGPEDDHIQAGATFVTQWLEELERDYSHPSIVGWCALNETYQFISDRVTVLDDATRALFLAAKAMDTTRPVLDTSGYSHRVPETDVYDSHDYEQDLEKFRAKHVGLAEGNPFLNGTKERPVSIPYRGQPYFVSEFGGTWWNPDVRPDDYSWGYGRRPESLDEFYKRFQGLCDVLLDDPHMFGYCYTQLTDVYQEQNGVYTFDRRLKFDAERLRRIQTKPAAIELAHR
ncbi:MAG: beta-galactosidase [Anaerolineae bacterium]|nr:beta-galactosidase [Anaerolineae bacterium]